MPQIPMRSVWQWSMTTRQPETLKIDNVKLYRVNADVLWGQKAENVTNEYAAGSLSVTKDGYR